MRSVTTLAVRVSKKLQTIKVPVLCATTIFLSSAETERRTCFGFLVHHRYRHNHIVGETCRYELEGICIPARDNVRDHGYVLGVAVGIICIGSDASAFGTCALPRTGIFRIGKLRLAYDSIKVVKKNENRRVESDRFPQ